jgi:hypothetical protein
MDRADSQQSAPCVVRISRVTRVFPESMRPACSILYRAECDCRIGKGLGSQLASVDVPYQRRPRKASKEGKEGEEGEEGEKLEKEGLKDCSWLLLIGGTIFPWTEGNLVSHIADHIFFRHGETVRMKTPGL